MPADAGRRGQRVRPRLAIRPAEAVDRVIYRRSGCTRRDLALAAARHRYCWMVVLVHDVVLPGGSGAVGSSRSTAPRASWDRRAVVGVCQGEHGCTQAEAGRCDAHALGTHCCRAVRPHRVLAGGSGVVVMPRLVAYRPGFERCPQERPAAGRLARPPRMLATPHADTPTRCPRVPGPSVRLPIGCGMGRRARSPMTGCCPWGPHLRRPSSEPSPGQASQ